MKVTCPQLFYRLRCAYRQWPDKPKDLTKMLNKAFFVGDHVALDFLNTIAAPRGEVIEFIPDGEAYLAWLVESALLDRTETHALLDRFGKPRLDRVASEARELREWFRQVIPKLAGTRPQAPTDEMIDTLNRILSSDYAYRQLERRDSHLVLRERCKITKVQQLLVPVAQKIAELFTYVDTVLIKRCSNPSCTLWFYDKTKAHRRLFCSTAVCGNRAKVAAYRERQKHAT